MPNKQNKPRTQSKRKGNGRGNAYVSAAGPVWPAGKPATELKSYYVSGANYQLFHNTAVPMTNFTNLIDNIVAGVAVNQRIGNSIKLHKLRVKMILNNKTDRPNVSYRVVAIAANSSAATDSFGELFPGGVITSLHAPQNSLLLHDTTFPVNQGGSMNVIATAKERSNVHTFEVPLDHTAVFNTSSSTCSTTLTVYIIAYDAFGTLTSDNIATVASVSWALEYFDS